VYDYDADYWIDWLRRIAACAAAMILVVLVAAISAGMERAGKQPTCPPSADGKQHVSSQYSPEGKLVACYYAKTGPGVAVEKQHN